MMNYVGTFILAFGLFTVLLINNYIPSDRDHGERVGGRFKRSLGDELSGGSPASKNQFKFMARLEIRHRQASEPLTFCGGALINNKFIATAKHCLYKYNHKAKKWDVNFDQMCLGCGASYICEVVLKDLKTDVSDGEIRVGIKRVLMPEGTSSELVLNDNREWVTKGTDFAVVELKKPVIFQDDPNIESILLHQKDVYPPDGEYVETLGWGLQYYKRFLYSDPHPGCNIGFSRKDFKKVTLEDCKKKCSEAPSSVCQSLHYQNSSMKCWLSKETKQTQHLKYKTPCSGHFSDVIYLEKNSQKMLAKVLQKGQLVMNNSGMKRTIDKDFIFTEVKLNKTSNQPIDPCAGDSGGPLMEMIGGKYYLLGTLKGYGYNCKTGSTSDEFQGRGVWNKIPHDWLLNLLREDWFPVKGYLYKALEHNTSFEEASQQCDHEGGILANPDNVQNDLIEIEKDLTITNRHNDVFWLNNFKNKAKQCVRMVKGNNGMFELTEMTCQGSALPFCQKENLPNTLSIDSSSPDITALEIPRSFKLKKILKINIEMTVLYDDDLYYDDNGNELNESDIDFPDPVTITLTAVYPNLPDLTWQIPQVGCSYVLLWSNIPNYGDIHISVSSNSSVITEVSLSLGEEREEWKDGCYEKDTDYPGNDLNLNTGRNEDRKESSAECQELCTQREGCKFFTWKQGSKECWLKTVGGYGKGHHQKGSISGPRVCEANTCTTDKGACIFPFTYKGKTYNECTKVNHNQAWCATKEDKTGNWWGNCPSTCKMHISGTFEYQRSGSQPIPGDGSIPFALTINIKVAFDQALKNHLGDEKAAAEYIYRVFDVAKTMFTHPSLGIRIHLIIVEEPTFLQNKMFAINPWAKDRLQIGYAFTIKKREPIPLIIFTYTDDTEYFTGTTHKRQVCNETSGVVITKYRSSTIVAARSLSHDLGHSLGLNHDGIEDKKKRLGVNTTCKGTGLMTDPPQFSVWSICSSMRLKRVYAREILSCAIIGCKS